MKKIAFLLVLASIFVACENESFEDAVFNEDTTTDTEETTDGEEDGEEITIGNQ